MLAAALALAAHGAGQKTVHNLDAFPLVCERVAAVEGREPSLLPKGVKLGLVWHDEFDGNSLDESKWSYRNDHMTGKGSVRGATWTIFKLAVDMGVLFVVSYAHCAIVHNAKMHNAKMDNEKENRT